MKRPLLVLVVPASLWPSLAAASCEKVATMVSTRGAIEIRRARKPRTAPQSHRRPRR